MQPATAAKDGAFLVLVLADALKLGLPDPDYITMLPPYARSAATPAIDFQFNDRHGRHPLPALYAWARRFGADVQVSADGKDSSSAWHEFDFTYSGVLFHVYARVEAAAQGEHPYPEDGRCADPYCRHLKRSHWEHAEPDGHRVGCAILSCQCGRYADAAAPESPVVQGAPLAGGLLAGALATGGFMPAGMLATSLLEQSIRTGQPLKVDDDDIDGDAPTPLMNETPCQHGNFACPLCDVPADPVDAQVEADRQTYFQRHEGEPTADAAMTCRRCKNAPALDDDVICAGCEAADAEGIRPLVFVRPDGTDPAADSGELPGSVVPLTSVAIRPLPRHATPAGVQIASVTR